MISGMRLRMSISACYISMSSDSAVVMLSICGPSSPCLHWSWALIERVGSTYMLMFSCKDCGKAPGQTTRWLKIGTKMYTPTTRKSVQYTTRVNTSLSTLRISSTPARSGRRSFSKLAHHRKFHYQSDAMRFWMSTPFTDEQKRLT